VSLRSEIRGLRELRRYLERFSALLTQATRMPPITVSTDVNRRPKVFATLPT
jgi:hypothetical protein